MMFGERIDRRQQFEHCFDGAPGLVRWKNCKTGIAHELDDRSASLTQDLLTGRVVLLQKPGHLQVVVGLECLGASGQIDQRND